MSLQHGESPSQLPQDNMEPPKGFIGLDIGGSQIKAVALDGDGRQLAEEVVPTPIGDSQGWRDRVKVVLHQIIESCPKPVRVGLAAPGLVSADGHSIAFMPNRLPGLEGLNWQQSLQLEHPVEVLNDAQAALLGEVWLGAARGMENVLLLTLGTGVGGAAMVDGRVLHGHIGRAGHLGHVSLNPDGAPDIVGTPGSLEDMIGECSLPIRSKGRFSNTQDLIIQFRNGSAEARVLWLRSVQGLAAALAGFINVLDPQGVVIGGGIADANEALFEPLQAGLDQFEWRPGGAQVRLMKAALGRNAGAIGAAYAAKLAAERQLS